MAELNGILTPSVFTNTGFISVFDVVNGTVMPFHSETDDDDLGDDEAVEIEEMTDSHIQLKTAVEDRILPNQFILGQTIVASQ